MIRRTRETYAFMEKYPQPTTPEEALGHVVALYEDEPDDRVMVEATSNIYADGVRTGLTMGDLRALNDRVEQQVYDLGALYERLCRMHTTTLLIHGPDAAGGLALAIKKIHEMLPASREQAPVTGETRPCGTQFPEGSCAGTLGHPGDCTPNADDILVQGR